MDMLSKNLARNLISLRTKQGLTQAMLAKRAQIPRSTITHLESGSGNPSVGNLVRVAASLRVSIEELIAEPKSHCTLMRRKDLNREDRGGGLVSVFNLLPGKIPGLQMETLEFRPQGWMRGTPHLSGSKEYLVCVEGGISLSVSGKTFELKAGDSLAFPGDQAHLYRNRSSRRSRCVSVVSLG